MNVATYSRVSSDPQDSGSSPRTQEEATRAKVVMEGWTHLGHFHDAISGTVAPEERPGFSSLLATRPDAILAHAQDRISRDELHWFLLSRDLAATGTALITLDGVDTRTGDGLLSGIRAVIAAEERRRIAQRTYQGRLASARDGRFPSNHSPFGFHLEDGRLVIEEVEARTLRHAVEMVIAGHDPADVARDLNARAWLSKGSPRSRHLPCPWTTASLKRALRQESLVGRVSYAGIDVPAPTVIPAPQFDHLQALLDAHDGRRAPKVSSRTYPLSNRMTVDGVAYRGCFSSGIAWYRARGRTMLRAEVIEARVIHEVYARLDDEVFLLDAYNAQTPAPDERVTMLRQKIAQVEDDLDVLLSRPGLRQALPRIDTLTLELDSLRDDLRWIEAEPERVEVDHKEVLLTARMLREARRPTLKEQEALYRALHLQVLVASVRPLNYRVEGSLCCTPTKSRTPFRDRATLLLTWES